jgi:membrane protein DedA with SNARE-associated domain
MPGFDLFAGWSYFGIILFLILTGCGFPLPEEVAFVYAGVNSALENLHWPLALASCLVGALLGDSVMYGIGRLGRNWVKHHAWFSRVVHLEREEQIKRLIARHGIWFFFGARFMVGVRGPLYVTLGVLKVPFWRFVLIDSVCASSVVCVFFALSYFFGQAVLGWIKQGETLFSVLAIAALVVGGGALWWLHHRRKVREAAEVVEMPPQQVPLAEGRNVAESLMGVTTEELLEQQPAEEQG